MTMFRQCARALSLLATLVAGFSCADDHEPEQGPTQEEMQQVAADLCEKGIECGSGPNDLTMEECIEYHVGTYRGSPECVAFYYFHECLTTQTCEEIERLETLHIGACVDERDEADKVICDPF
jgi:hypothetical protein